MPKSVPGVDLPLPEHVWPIVRPMWDPFPKVSRPCSPGPPERATSSAGPRVRVTQVYKGRKGPSNAPGLARDISGVPPEHFFRLRRHSSKWRGGQVKSTCHRKVLRECPWQLAELEVTLLDLRLTLSLPLLRWSRISRRPPDRLSKIVRSICLGNGKSVFAETPGVEQVQRHPNLTPGHGQALVSMMSGNGGGEGKYDDDGDGDGDCNSDRANMDSQQTICCPPLASRTPTFKGVCADMHGLVIFGGWTLRVDSQWA